VNTAEVVAMLIKLRDSITEMSLMLKDYQANLDAIHNGPFRRQTSEYLDTLRGKSGTVKN